MPRNGSGQYTLPGGINPVQPNTLIETGWANPTLTDIAQALTNSLAKDGQTAMTGALNMDGHRIRNVADPTDPKDAVSLEFLTSKGLDRLGVSGWGRPDSGTFPPLTLTGDYTIEVPEGTGYVINPDTGSTFVSWAAQSVVLTGVTSSWATTIAVNAAGTITQLAGNVDESWARNYVILGVAVHPLGVVTSILNAPSILGNVAYGMYDLAMVARNMAISGGQISGNALDALSFDMAARRVFYYGGTPNDFDAVNFVDYPEVVGVRFFPITGASTAEASTFDVPVGMYDPLGAGTPVAIPGDANASTVFRLYEMGGTFFLLYGQNVYPSLDAAVVAIGTEPLVMPEKLSNATLVGVIATKKSTTDLKDTDSTQLVSNPGSSGGTSVNVDGYVWKSIEVTGDTIVDRTFRNAIVWSDQPTPIQLTIRANTGDEERDWRPEDGPFSVIQAGIGRLTVVVEGTDVLVVPDGFEAETRTQGSTISGFSWDLPNGKWAVSGDLMQSLSDPAKMLVRMDDRTVLSSTNIAVGTLRASVILPYNLQLDTVVNKGLYATLMAVQTSGSLLTVDVKVNGVSILATLLTFDLNEKTTTTAAAAAVYSAAFLAANRIISAGSEVTYDVTQVGTAGAKGLSLYLYGQRA